WKTVIVDRPERCSLVLLFTGEELHGFAAKSDGWELVFPEPAFTFRSEWRQVFPDLTAELPLDAWRIAWQAWCQSRSVPTNDVTACALSRRANRLTVVAPRKVFDRLRASARDAIRGNVWLLAGEGRTR